MSRYGYATWQNELHPTRDKVIPWKLFLLLARALPRIRASEQLAIAHGVTLGYVAARIPKKDAFKFTRKLKRLEAFAFGEDLEDERGRARDRVDDDA